MRVLRVRRKVLRTGNRHESKVEVRGRGVKAEPDVTIKKKGCFF